MNAASRPPTALRYPRKDATASARVGRHGQPRCVSNPGSGTLDQEPWIRLLNPPWPWCIESNTPWLADWPALWRVL